MRKTDKIKGWYLKLNKEQQIFLVFGGIIPAVPAIFGLPFYLVFDTWTVAKMIGDFLLLGYSVICSSCNIYVSIKKETSLLAAVGYILLMILVAIANVILNIFEKTHNRNVTVIILAVSFVIVGISSWCIFNNTLQNLASSNIEAKDIVDRSAKDGQEAN